MVQGSPTFDSTLTSKGLLKGRGGVPTLLVTNYIEVFVLVDKE